MEYDIRREQVSSHPLAVVRRRASLQELPKVIPAACGVVWNAVKAKKIAGAGRLVALYLDDEHIARFANGVRVTVTHWRAQAGKFMTTGRTRGIPTRRKYEPMFTIC